MVANFGRNLIWCQNFANDFFGCLSVENFFCTKVSDRLLQSQSQSRVCDRNRSRTFSLQPRYSGRSDQSQSDRKRMSNDCFVTHILVAFYLFFVVITLSIKTILHYILSFTTYINIMKKYTIVHLLLLITK